MVWTSPMSFVANTALTAAQLNTFVRDNLNETAPAKATTAGSIFIASGRETIVERRIAASLVVGTFQTLVSDYSDPPSSVGPTVTVNTGTRAYAMMTLAARNVFFTLPGFSKAKCSIAVTGATTIAPSDETAWIWNSTGQNRFSVAYWFELTAGSNTFTMKYAAENVNDDTNYQGAQFATRELVVVAF